MSVHQSRHDLAEAGHASRAPALPLEAAFAAEERDGHRLGFKLRLIALGLIALFLAVMEPFPAVLYYYALLLGLVVTGAGPLAHWRHNSGIPEWTRWTGPCADLALVTFAVVYPNPFVPTYLSALPLILRSEHLVYLVIASTW